MKAKIIDGLVGNKVATEVNDTLADLAKAKKRRESSSQQLLSGTIDAQTVALDWCSNRAVSAGAPSVLVRKLFELQGGEEDSVISA